MLRLLSILLLLVLSPFWAAADNDDCLDCHNDTELISERRQPPISLYVSPETFAASIHADMDCTDCHSALNVEEHPDSGDPAPVVCAECHDAEQEEFDTSVHSLSTLEIGVPTPNCRSCHGDHNIKANDDTTSRTYKLNVQKMCAECHSKPEVLKSMGIRGGGPAAGYEGSVHDQMSHGDKADEAPTCINCHGTHNVVARMSAECPISKGNVAGTCGACHTKIAEEYKKSIHWKALARGHTQSPTCNDCHGEHGIVSHENVDSVTNRLNLSSKVCANCHASPVMMARYGLDYRRFESYGRSYHGLALFKGDLAAATCTSCHKVHEIQSATNPLSSVHKSNLRETCSKCHKNINEAFISIEVHPLDQKQRNPIAYVVRIAYFWMILLVIGGMFLHNVIIFVSALRRKKKHHKQEATIQRFRPWEVYQHVLMFLSFMALALSGFSLKFPDSAWVQLFQDLGMNEATRALTHRVAAVVMIVISIIQAGYLLFTKNGHKDLRALRLGLQDLKDVVINLKYYLGLSKEKPQFGKFDYGEKAEYLALIWGTIVMVATGFILWFPEWFIGYLPAWVFEVAEVAHYYEAWLATLAILVWHWFFVIYHPEQYPVNMSLLDGKISEEDLKHHHPAQYKELMEEREKENKE